MTKLVLAFDMDNTLCETDQSILNRAITHCKWRDLDNELREFKECLPGGLNTLSPECLAIIQEEVIEKRFYMEDAAPSSICDNLEFLDSLYELEKLPDVKVVICTHRGDNISAWLSTHRWLDKYLLVNQFNMIHSINHVLNKDKVAYLKSVYPEHKVLLVDDNPFGSTSTVRDKCDSVLIYDGIVSLPCHENQDKFVSMKDLVEKIRGIISDN